MRFIFIVITILFVTLGYSQQVWEEIYDLQGIGTRTIEVDLNDHIYLGTTDGVFVSAEGGKSWRNIGLNDIDIFNIAFGNNGQLYASTQSDLYTSKDNGVSWEKIGNFYSPEDIVINKDGTIFVATFDHVFYSKDDGTSWIHSTEGFPEYNSLVWSLFIDSRGNIFAGTQCGLYRSIDKGLTWSFIESFNCGDILSFAENSDGVLYMVGADRFDGVYRSDDYGLNWSQVFDFSQVELPGLNSHSIIIKNGQKYITSRYGIFRSTNNDTTWESINTGLAGVYVIQLTIDSKGNIYAVYFDKFYRLTNCCENTEIENYDFQINNLTMRLDHFANINQNDGLLWNDGENYLTTLVQDNFFLSAKVNGEIKMAGSYNHSSFYPGKILPDFRSDDPSKKEYKVWRIRSNYDQIENDSLRQVYINNYSTWPIEIGAPWLDVNMDGLFTHGFDSPFIHGSELSYSVGNDLDTLRSEYALNSSALGVEVHTVVFGFNADNYLDDVVIKKFTIINKSNDTFENVIFSNYALVSFGVGDQTIVVGCDSLLDLGFGYSINNTSALFDSLNIVPHTIGHVILQGPVVRSSVEDSAYYNFRWHKGKRNLAADSFSPYYVEPKLPWEDSFRHMGELSLLQHGFKLDGQSYYDPGKSAKTKFPYSGDPESGIGWVRSGLYKLESSYFLNTGPVTMVPGDTQEVVYAIIVAKGDNNLNSVTKLKEKARLIQEFYYDSLLTPNIFNYYTAPEKGELSQNYPNPFNNSTFILYRIPMAQKVVIDLYNNLGQKVKTILNKYHLPGNYRVSVNASSLASGVYYYKLKTPGFEQTRKMLLLR